MEASNSPVQAARDHYGQAVQDVERQFAETYSQIDGDYSRTTQYAGLVRDELLNTAKARRLAGLSNAEVALNQAIHQAAGTAQPGDPQPEAAPALVQEGTHDAPST